MLALVIDDSRAMRKVIARILKDNGFDVLEAGDGQQALDVLAGCETLPQVALIDWNMPVMDGLTFVKTVRANPDYRELTLMMVTTESEHSRIVRALAAGAHEYLLKPFGADALLDKLSYLGCLPVAS